MVPLANNNKSNVGTHLPPEVLLVLLLVAGEVEEVLGQLLRALVVEHVDVGAGRGARCVVRAAHHDRHHGDGERLVELLRHVARAERVLEGEVESAI